MPDVWGNINADELAQMTAHEFRRHFPQVDRARRLLRMSWREYRDQVVRSMVRHWQTSVTTDSTEATYA